MTMASGQFSQTSWTGSYARQNVAIHQDFPVLANVATSNSAFRNKPANLSHEIWRYSIKFERAFGVNLV